MCVLLNLYAVLERQTETLRVTLLFSFFVAVFCFFKLGFLGQPKRRDITAEIPLCPRLPLPSPNGDFIMLMNKI